ncbi:MAG: hypothetical protein MI807_00220 [Verrucomicrobiales bacterium]|nr:hypothetical protein [Verrucomicrobiales bacterium]
MRRFAKKTTVAILFVIFATSQALPWGVGHRTITSAALSVQPDDLLKRWEVLHINPHHKEEASVRWYVENKFCSHPDWVDGPSRDEGDLEERVRITGFVYAEKNGKFLPPITYAGPDRLKWEGPRPKTYHYFTLQTEQLNREFARKGSKWYFENISRAFRKGEDVIAAEYFGAFAHAIQDRVSPFHVWDGYKEEREHFETGLAAHGLQAEDGSRNGNAINTSLFWSVGGQGMKADLSGYRPKSLGDTPETASKEFTERLFASREYAKAIYTDGDGFVHSHLSDEWREKGSGPETDHFLGMVASENAKLTADALFTAFLLSK